MNQSDVETELEETFNESVDVSNCSRHNDRVKVTFWVDNE